MALYILFLEVARKNVRQDHWGHWNKVKPEASIDDLEQAICATQELMVPVAVVPPADSNVALALLVAVERRYGQENVRVRLVVDRVCGGSDPRPAQLFQFSGDLRADGVFTTFLNRRIFQDIDICALHPGRL